MSLPNPKPAKPTLLIGMSGPPRCGKNALAEALALEINDRHGIECQLLALSTPMREVVYALLGQEYSEEHYEHHKDDPQSMFNGNSIRREMIELSERHVKPRLGGRFWAKSMLQRVWEPQPRVIIVTDMGFQAEVDEFADVFGTQCTLYPQIIRPGRDFSNDSRSYVGTPERRTSIINDETIEIAAGRIYGRLVNQFGWDFS